MTWRVWGLGFRVQGSGVKHDLECLGLRVQGSGFRVQKVLKVHDCDLDQGLGFRV